MRDSETWIREKKGMSFLGCEIVFCSFALLELKGALRRDECSNKGEHGLSVEGSRS